MLRLVMVNELQGAFAGNWVLTIYDGKTEKISTLKDAAVRELEKALVFKTPNSVALNYVGLHVSLNESNLEVCSLKRGVARYKSVYANRLDNVVRTIDGKRYNLRRYVVEGEVTPFCRASAYTVAGSDEEVLDESAIKNIYAGFKKSRDDRSGRGGKSTSRDTSGKSRQSERGRRGGIGRTTGNSSHKRDDSPEGSGVESETESRTSKQDGSHATKIEREMYLSEEETEAVEFGEEMTTLKGTETVELSRLETDDVITETEQEDSVSFEDFVRRAIKVRPLCEERIEFDAGKKGTRYRVDEAYVIPKEIRVAKSHCYEVLESARGFAKKIEYVGEALPQRGSYLLAVVGKKTAIFLYTP